jgi:hypothetical protein
MRDTYHPALIVLFNHKYERNIPIIREMYRKRFSSIFFLVPFYSGDQPDVIPVYENPTRFQGYLAQGFHRFYSPQFTHYLFVADDLILNPAIDERNYYRHLKLDRDSSFIPRLECVPPKHLPVWPGNRAAINFNPYRQGAEIRSEIPCREEASRLLERHGIGNSSFSFRQVYGTWDFSISFRALRHNVNLLSTYAYDRLVADARMDGLRYPLAKSYSDILAVAAPYIQSFCHLCGAFAARDLFVELAIPTALALVSGKIVTERNLSLRGQALWSAEDLRILEPYRKQLNELLLHFPKDYLYLHPVKLSQWRIGPT